MSYIGQDAGDLTPREMYGRDEAPHFLVWSARHNKWYGPNRAGYVDDLRGAGRYTRAEAGDVVTCALPGQLFAVDETLAHNVLAELRGADVTARIDTYRNY